MPPDQHLSEAAAFAGKSWLPVYQQTLKWTLYVFLEILFFLLLLEVANFFSLFRSYSSSFRFESISIWLAKPIAPCLITSIYVCSVILLQRLFRSRRPLRLHPFAVLHNALLSILSLLTFVLMLPSIWRGLRKGFYYSICSEEMHSNSVLHLVYFFNYFLKYFEFLDTILLALKKRPIEFLHFYHHAVTLLLTYIQQRHFSTVQWVPISINLFVHIIMYYYYFLVSLGVRHIWWKRLLTLLQISQFFIDLSVCWFCWISVAILPTDETCHGTHFGAASGIAIITSYLVLFLFFYAREYKNSSPATASATVVPFPSSSSSSSSSSSASKKST